jgi:hypothetical protein
MSMLFVCSQTQYMEPDTITDDPNNRYNTSEYNLFY